MQLTAPGRRTTPGQAHLRPHPAWYIEAILEKWKTIMENQMEKKMENEMETRCI